MPFGDDLDVYHVIGIGIVIFGIVVIAKGG